MKLHFNRDWIKRQISELDEERIDEPCIIGAPVMNINVLLDTWIVGKIEHLESLIDTEMKDIEERDSIVEKESFPNIGNTNILRWEAQIDVLREVEDFLGTATKE